MTGLTLKDIRKSYGAVDVIHGINLDIKQGEFVVFRRSVRLRQVDTCCA